MSIELTVARTTVPPAAPEVWPHGRDVARRVLAPVERFLHIEAASGLVLLVATAVALAWANSRFAASYHHLWHAELSLGLGERALRAPLHFVVNDVLMVIFFFVVGLEIRRELHDGELSEPARAALPVVAALGGMIVPAVTFFALNATRPHRSGWGVPMATDIAFAVAALTLLGRRVPSALRVLLLALAIIDDIGAVLVIALFYSSSFAWSGLAIAGVAIAATLLMQRLGVRHAVLYLAPGALLWAGVLRAGVHPTIAGVLLGLLTPARAWFGLQGFVARTRSALGRVPVNARPEELTETLDAVGRARREAVAPVVRLQHALHPWVAFGIMPLFALANAGVTITRASVEHADARLVAGIVLGLVLGKPLGVVACCALAVRLGVARLPRRATLQGVTVVGCVAGVGFTMALFIAELAFTDAAALSTAKLAVLAASLFAAVLALTLGRWALPIVGSDVTEAEAERSTAD